VKGLLAKLENKMKISALQKDAMKDYPGKISTIIFTGRCNYRCPTCHAKKILGEEKNISKEEVLNYLDSRKDWIQGVVICGGEPTMELDLIPFLEKIKERGLSVKLDTNGSSPDFLRELNKRELVDYCAMDVKGPMSLYAKLTGRNFINERDDVAKGIAIVSKFPDYEFRTTIVPIIENEKLRWMTPKEISETAELICNYTENNKHKYFLQKFVARSKEEMIDERFAKENLSEEFWATPKTLLEECLIEAKKYLPNAGIR
jgi:pyruvate formate lyase activating enzyme